MTDAAGKGATGTEAAGKQVRTQLKLANTAFVKDNKLSFEALLTKQREIQENLFLDTQI